MRPSLSYISQLSLVTDQVRQELAEGHSFEGVATIVEHATANSGLAATSSIIDSVGITGFADIAKLVAALAAKLQVIAASNFIANFDRDFAARAVVSSTDLEGV